MENSVFLEGWQPVELALEFTDWFSQFELGHWFHIADIWKFVLLSKFSRIMNCCQDLWG